MTFYTLDDISTSNERHKLYVFENSSALLPVAISTLKSTKVPVVNIGAEVSMFLNQLEDYSYLSIDVYDFTKKLLNRSKAKIEDRGNDVISIYNFGILLEPRLELNVAQMLKDFSKSTSLIIIWEYSLERPDRLEWPTQKQKHFFDFSDTQLKRIQHEI